MPPTAFTLSFRPVEDVAELADVAWTWELIGPDGLAICVGADEKGRMALVGLVRMAGFAVSELGQARVAELLIEAAAADVADGEPAPAEPVSRLIVP